MRNIRVTRKIRQVLAATPDSKPDTLPARPMIIGNQAGVGVSVVFNVLDKLASSGLVVGTYDGLNQALRYKRTERGDELLTIVTR